MRPIPMRPDPDVLQSPVLRAVHRLASAAAGMEVELQTDHYYRPDYDDPGQNFGVLETEGVVSSLSEVALHSRVTLGPGTVMHIPMIDFITPDVDVARSLLLAQCRTVPWLLVSSGRSYHAYLGALVHFVGITRWLGCLLSLRGVHDVVDHRWVGHSLRRTCMHLRLTNRTSWYKAEPTIVHEHQPHLGRYDFELDPIGTLGSLAGFSFRPR